MDKEHNEQEQDKQPQFQCTGDCLKCLPMQRQYCASQHIYVTMRMVENISKELSAVKEAVEDLSEKVKAIQGNESLLFTPNIEEGEGTGMPQEPA